MHVCVSVVFPQNFTLIDIQHANIQGTYVLCVCLLKVQGSFVQGRALYAAFLVLFISHS